jgi:hypothetical protein
MSTKTTNIFVVRVCPESVVDERTQWNVHATMKDEMAVASTP